MFRLIGNSVLFLIGWGRGYYERKPKKLIVLQENKKKGCNEIKNFNEVKMHSESISTISPPVIFSICFLQSFFFIILTSNTTDISDAREKR